MSRYLTAGFLLWCWVAAADGPARPAGPHALTTPAEGWRVSLPGRAVRRITLNAENADWSDKATLSLTVRADPPPVRPLRLLVGLIAGDEWWYQCAELVSVAGPRKRHVHLDLGHLSTDWTPRGHLRPWDGYAKQRVSALSVSVFSPVRYTGSVHLGDVTLEPVRPADAPKRFVYDAEVVTPEPRVGRPALLSFRLSTPYPNPFESGLVSVTLEDERGEAGSAPAFFYQAYRRAEWGALVPVGAPAWRARVLASRPGRFRWRVTAQDGPDRVQLGAGELAVGPAKPTGIDEYERPTLAEMHPFVLPRRAHAKVPVFRLTQGKWKLEYEANKEPVIRAWRVPLEWTARWGKFHGLGRYNLENAWLFDQLIERAEVGGLRLPFALNADEAFQGQKKYNWFSNPLGAHMGGPLDAPSRYFTDAKAQHFFRQQVEYILARWGNSPAVSRFELWMSVPANHAETWHERMAGFLRGLPLAGKPVISRHPQGARLGERRHIANFERQWADWRAEPRISPATRITRVTVAASEGRGALQAVADYPGEAALYSPVKESWNGYSRLAFDVYVPKEAPADMRAMLYVRERDWWWYETLLKQPLRRGDWTKLIVPISPASTIWKPCGHTRQWDGYVAQDIREMGIRVFGHLKYSGPVYIDNIELWPDPDPPKPIRLTDLAANSKRVGQYEKYELTFRLSHVFRNPFDPAEADVRGHFVSPGGKHVEVPGFFHQPYERRLVGGAERLTAVGSSAWKVRFATAELGDWSCYVQVNGAPLNRDKPLKFVVVGSDRPGYVRRSRRDPNWFEFTSGKFFYPIGHTLRSPSDGRRPYAYRFQTPDGKGTYVYDDYFRAMQKAGENMARVWMCSWWCGLEWNKKWHGFGGIGRYNMENAWRLDHLVDRAEQHGIHIALDMTNHGQYSTDIDHEWENNPYNVANGGFLPNAKDFFSNGKAIQKLKDRLRYTIARWGYSPNILMWTIFSEVEFVEEYWQYNKHGAQYCSPLVAPWHGKIARFIRATDPFGHLVSTHVSHPWRGHDIWARPELSVIQSNAYSKYPELGKVDVVSTLLKVYHDKLKQFRRPVIVAEYGGHWMRNPKGVLDAELHAGLWGTVMMPYAGNTGFWWWLHVHFADRYPHYRAVANFMKGEDRRGKNLQQGNFLVTSDADVLRAVGLQNDTSANVWVYHHQVPTSLKNIPAVNAATLGIAGLTDGLYHVELWDTYRGVKTGEKRVKAVGRRLVIPLPSVQNDLALKVALLKAAHTSPDPK